MTKEEDLIKFCEKNNIKLLKDYEKVINRTKIEFECKCCGIEMV